MRKNRFYTYICILVVGVFLSACSVDESKVLNVPQPVCPKPEMQDLSQNHKDNIINIDKVVMIMPEEEKKAIAKTKPAVVKKKSTMKKKIVKKKPVVKIKKESKPTKTVVTAPKKLIKKKENLKNIEKNIGDRVCRNSKGLMGFMPLDLTGIVQGKKADTIKVKIIESRSDNPTYDGIGLYKNTMVWDKFSNWKLCK